jgi:RES domain
MLRGQKSGPANHLKSRVEAKLLSPNSKTRAVTFKLQVASSLVSIEHAADLATVMELAGWTNDRLVVDRISRLPQTEWVYGTPNASIVMTAFLHVAPGGMRFNGPDLGAWYAADDIRTAAAEVGHHLRRETVARNATTMTRTYRAYAATLLGDYVDITLRLTLHGIRA